MAAMLVLAGPSYADAQSEAPTAEADAAHLRYARPADAHSLPRAFAADLTRRGCSIPQSVTYSGEAQAVDNVIHGRFARRGQQDIAIICSIAGVSQVEIFWGGSARCTEPIPVGVDVDSVTDGDVRGVPTRGYGRGIDRATQKTIAEYADAFGGPSPPDRTHDGIDVSNEKASIIYYCSRGRWRELQGMD